RRSRQKMFEENPTGTTFQSELADSHFNIGTLLNASGKPAEAMTSFKSALVMFQRLADANPNVPEMQRRVASYLQVTDEHFQRAVQGGAFSGAQEAHFQAQQAGEGKRTNVNIVMVSGKNIAKLPEKTASHQRDAVPRTDRARVLKSNKVGDEGL